MVSASKLHAAERLVDELDLADRVRLLQYLAPRIAQVSSPKPPAPSVEPDEAWQRLHEVGSQIAAAAAKVGGPSMTQLVSDMRR